jgi:hypothetical protein
MQTDQTRSPLRSCPADAVIADGHPQCAVSLINDDLRMRRPGVLGDVGERFGDYVVRRHLHRRRVPGLGIDVQVDRDDRPAGERPQCQAEPARGEDRGVNAPRCLA